MNRLALVLTGAAVLAGCCCRTCCEEGLVVEKSPDGRNEIRLHADPLAYEVLRDGKVVVAKSGIGMTVDGACLTKGAKAPKTVRLRRSGREATPVYKKGSIDLTAGETFVDYGDWGVRLIARNDGVAYRFETKKAGAITVENERADVTIPSAEAKVALNYGTSFGVEGELPYSCLAKEIKTSTDPKTRRFAYLPFVYKVGDANVVVTESDVRDYPFLNLTAAPATEAGVTLSSLFSKTGKSSYHEVTGRKWSDRVRVAKGGRWIRLEGEENYLVKTAGTRTFPWRTFILADRPSQFCEADIVYALAPAADKTADFSWVKPGKVAWDWWNAFDNKGDPQGCTTETYERFIDFAAKAGLEYVVFDEGWSANLDIWKNSPAVDVPHLIAYGAKKGVDIILWMSWAQVYGEEEKVASHFAKLGAKGFKIDFLERGDAEVANFIEKFAAACAKEKMLVVYHGCPRPTGLQRKYPNIINYEGVRGLEYAKWFRNDFDFMDNDVKAFFLRLTAGPMDYTPGAMDNYPIGRYKGTRNNPGSVGTRCRQIAMMSLYEAPLQMLADSPTKYEKNMECFRFMAATPVVWNATVGLGGSPDTYAAAARLAKDGAWWASAINNATAREVTIDTAFLKAGTWTAEIFRDADDADTAPTHYIHETKRVTAGEKMSFRMAAGGGFAVRFTK